MPDIPLETADTDPVQDALNVANNRPYFGATVPQQQTPVGSYLAGKIGDIGRMISGAVTLPGDVYAARTDPFSSEARRRALDLAQLVTMGAGAGEMPTGALGMGAARRTEPEMVNLIHMTDEAGADAISKTGKISGPVFMTAKPTEYGTIPIPVSVPKSELKIDFDLPGGRLLNVDDANTYSGKEGWTIDDYLRNNHNVAIDRDVEFGGAKPSQEDALRLSQQAIEQNPRIIAYHGSPYDFNQFDISKIGTGEGAQAYGHGLYFAESEPVAESYRKTLTKPYMIGPDAKAMEDYGDQWKELVQERMNAAGEYFQGDTSSIDAKMQDLHQRMMDESIERNPSLLKGRMYQVSINAHPDHFLDWDAPLSEQSPIVQEKLAKIDPDQWHPEGNDYDPFEKGQMTYQRLKPVQGNKKSYFNSMYTYGNEDIATKRLSELGIPGIKYFDAASRGAGEGSRNYVVFDPRHIEILKKYGIPASAISTGTGAALMNQGQPKKQLPPGFGTNPLEMSQGGKIKDALRLTKK